MHRRNRWLGRLYFFPFSRRVTKRMSTIRQMRVNRKEKDLRRRRKTSRKIGVTSVYTSEDYQTEENRNHQNPKERKNGITLLIAKRFNRYYVALKVISISKRQDWRQVVGERITVYWVVESLRSNHDSTAICVEGNEHLTLESNRMHYRFSSHFILLVFYSLLSTFCSQKEVEANMKKLVIKT